MFADDDYKPKAGDVIDMGSGTTWTVLRVYPSAVDLQIHHNGIRSARPAPGISLFYAAVSGKPVRRAEPARRSA